MQEPARPTYDIPAYSPRPEHQPPAGVPWITPEPKQKTSSEGIKPQYQQTYIRMCAGQRFRSACANVQDDPIKVLIRWCECTGWSSDGSDQTAHLRSLIRTFTGCHLESQGCKVYSC